MLESTLVFSGYMWLRFGFLAKKSNQSLPYYMMIVIGIILLLGVGIKYFYQLIGNAVISNYFFRVTLFGIVCILLLAALYFDFLRIKKNLITRNKPSATRKKISLDMKLVIVMYFISILIYCISDIV
jgi:hypothetical protein